MDRLVFVVVALALLLATQAQAWADAWFDAHCLESRSIIASARPAETRRHASSPAAASAQPASKPVRSTRRLSTEAGR